MSTSTMHGAATANDRAQILSLIDARTGQTVPAATELESRDLTIWMSGDSAFSHGLVRASGTRRPEQFWISETISFERTPDGWRIVHQHTSSPFYLEAGSHQALTVSNKLRVVWVPGRAPLQPGS